MTGISISRRGGRNDDGNDDEEEKRLKEQMQASRKQAEQVARLMDSGATASQISAYSGMKLVKLQDKFTPEPKVTPSHMFVPKDEDGKSI